MIQEFQEETVRMCPNCQGYITIDSHAHKSTHDTRIFGISIPIYACDNCQAEAREEYRKRLNRPEYEYVYLQDKKGDEYRAYNMRDKKGNSLLKSEYTTLVCTPYLFSFSCQFKILPNLESQYSLTVLL